MELGANNFEFRISDFEIKNSQFAIRNPKSSPLCTLTSDLYLFAEC
jgi:hypothetical protein